MCTAYAVDGEEQARDRRERGGEPVDVVQQVERIRHPDQPHEPIAVAATGLETILTRSPAANTSAAAATWAPIFINGRRRAHVVEEPRDEQDQAAAENPPEPTRRRQKSRGDGDPRADEQTGEDARAPEHGVDRVCQRSARGAATTCWAAGVRRSSQIASRLVGRAVSAAAAVIARHASAARPVPASCTVGSVVKGC